jgi:hypothetical protein
MSPEQIVILKAALLAETDPALVAARDSRNDTELARLLNLDSAFTVWKTNLTRKEMHGAYVGTEMDNFTNGAKQFQFNLLLSEGSINPSSANVRAWLAEIFTGAGFANTRANLVVLLKRPARVVEKYFATGTGTNGSPGTLTFEGSVSIDDLGKALSN